MIIVTTATLYNYQRLDAQVDTSYCIAPTFLEGILGCVVNYLHITCETEAGICLDTVLNMYDGKLNKMHYIDFSF